MRYSVIFRNSFLLIDLILLNSSCFICGYYFFKSNGLDLPVYWVHYILIINLLWTLLTYQLQFISIEFSLKNLFTKTFFNFSFFILFLYCYLFYFKTQEETKFILITQASIQLLMIVLSRVIISKNIHKIKAIEKNKIRAIIVGHSLIQKKVVEKLHRIDSGYSIVEYLESDLIYANASDDAIREKVIDFINIAEHKAINEIFLIDFPIKNIEWKKIINIAEKKFIRIKFIPNYDDLFLANPSIKLDYGLPIISFRNDPLEKVENRIIKRIFDIVFSLLIFALILSWLLPLLIIIIKTTSKGPIFFLQKRSGKNGVVFNCVKLRTMYVNTICDELAANKNDYRITSFGKFLRRSNLDELPQFYNVLKGEMSIIGPRPHMLKHTEEFGKVIDQYNLRHFLKPGISGWAQINGYRGDLSGNKMQKRVEYDLWYMENWSFLLDLRIILKTLWITLKGDNNAY